MYKLGLYTLPTNKFYNLTIQTMDKELLKKLKQKFMWARDRCTNPNSQRRSSYWWRGIKFLWESFDDFYKDMAESFVDHVKRYWIIETTIDRIDTNWNYCKDNCRRATRREQYERRTRDHNILIWWVNLWNRTTIANMVWVNPSTFRVRLESWWSVEKAIATKVRKTSKEIDYQWKHYKSVKEFATAMWLSYTRTKMRINKWRDLDKVVNCPKWWDFLYDKQHKNVSIQW